MLRFNAYGIADAPPQDSTLRFGLWYGRAERHEGPSRAHQSRILDTSGGIIYTAETHDELEVGQRVRFTIGFDKLGIEQLAVQVKPTTITSPKARNSK